MFVILVVCGILALAAGMSRRRAIARAIGQIEERGGVVEFGYDLMSKHERSIANIAGRELVDEELKGFRGVERVRLAQATCSDADLQLLRHFPELQSLFVIGAPVTEDGLHHLQDHKNLRHLVLQDVSMGRALSVVRGMPQLEAMIVVRGNVRDDDLAAIERCGRLEHLNLNHNREIQRCGEHIGKLTALELLSLTGTGVDEEILPDLMRLPSLKHLLLNQTAVTRLAISQSGDFPSLQTLDLRETPLKEIDPAVWAKFPKLEYLAVANTAISFNQLASIDRLGTIERLVVSESQLHEDLPILLSRMSSLKFLLIEPSEGLLHGETAAIAERWQRRVPRVSISVRSRTEQRQHIVGLGKFHFLYLQRFLDPPDE